MRKVTFYYQDKQGNLETFFGTLQAFVKAHPDVAERWDRDCPGWRED